MKLIIILLCSFLATLAYSQSSNKGVLDLTDIHFNPYEKCTIDSSDCKALAKLIVKPISKWRKTLDNTIINQLNQETNNALLVQGLVSLEPIARQHNVSAIFITGDLLSHKFKEDYYRYAPAKYQTKEYYRAFCYKTISYIIEQLHLTLPKANIYLALGNNDSDTQNYQLASKSMLEMLAKELIRFIPNNDNNHKVFLATYNKGGYYSSELGNNVTLIALNSNLLSKKSPNDKEALEQLSWLSARLKKAKNDKHKVIMIQHIPYGMDLFKTITIGIPTKLLKQELQDKYLQLINSYSSIIINIYAGHLHSEYWSLITGNIPLIGTIAFNAGFGNNPGFKIINLAKNWKLLGYQTYYADLKAIAKGTDAKEHKTIFWQSLYKIGRPSKLFKEFLTNFPADIKDQKVKDYRKHYRAISTAGISPINDNNKWKYYYCAIKRISESSYNECLNNFVAH